MFGLIASPDFISAPPGPTATCSQQVRCCCPRGLSPGEIPSESVRSCRAPPVAFQGPGPSQPALLLGLLCCHQTWATCSQGQPWGTSVRQDCILTPEFRLHNLPPSPVSLGSMGHPACSLSGFQNPWLRCCTIKPSVTVHKIGRVGSETRESESEYCSVLSHL